MSCSRSLNVCARRSDEQFPRHTSCCCLLSIYGPLLFYVEYDSLSSLTETPISILLSESSSVVGAGPCREVFHVWPSTYPVLFFSLPPSASR